MRFEVANDRGGRPTWWLYGDNHKLVAWAGETFASSYNAHRSAAAFKAAAKIARYEVYLDGSGQYRWRAWRSSDKVAASGESFSSRWAAQAAADNVRDNAGNAGGLAAA
ncbi:MAG TPA: hypothetical protein VGX49_14235 [Jatrophihabitans sp.]|nr:hypothetical protein [Jatrophihabitans sp.]